MRQCRTARPCEKFQRFTEASRLPVSSSQGWCGLHIIGIRVRDTLQAREASPLWERSHNYHAIKMAIASVIMCILSACMVLTGCGQDGRVL